MKRLLFAIFTGIVFVASLLGSGLIRPTAANALSAANWSAGRIIDDRIFADSSALSVDQIQAFLNAKVPSCDTNGSSASSHWYAAGNRYYTRAEWGAQSGNPAPYVCLKNYVENLGTGQNNVHNPGGSVPGGLSAAQIISGAGTQYMVNPEVLIVLLQKEQSLVTDDWPWATQYTQATGAYCPDTAACDVAHAGFGNQVYTAARLFRSYIDSPDQYNYAPGMNNILYNPSTACGTSQVYVQTRATAALYNYTPYQPNTAALNNLYGTGDNCSAYGNRNFWRMFNDWFGSTTGSVSIVKADDNATLYFRDKNTIRPIPSMAVLEAWGFTGDMVSTLDDTTFNTLSVVGPNLSQVVKVSGTNDIFFVDSGHHYYVRPESAGVWGFTTANALPLPAETIQATFGGGTLGNNLTASADNGTVYAVDGTQKRAFTSLEAFNTWTGGFGGVSKVSDAYFNSLSTGSAISTNFFTYSGGTYMIDGAVKHRLAGASSSLAPSGQTTMSDRLFSFYFTGDSLTPLLRGPNGAIYLLDNGVKRPIGSLDVANAWKPSSGYMSLSDAALSLIPTGALWTQNIVRGSDSTVYVLDQQKKYPMTGSILEGYTGGVTPPLVSDGLLSTIPTSSQNASDFVKSGSDGTVYFLDYGKKRGITSYAAYSALDGGRNMPVQSMSDGALRLIPAGPNIGSSFILNDQSGVVFDNGTYRTMSAAAATHWGLSTTTPPNASTMARYTNAGAVTNLVRTASTYVMFYGGTMYRTDNANSANLWGLNTSTTTLVGTNLIESFTGRVIGLSQFARNADQPGDGTIYLVDTSSFIPIPSGDLFVGLGANGGFTTSIPQALIQNQLAVGGARAKLGTVTGGHTYVFDDGKKREITTGYGGYWTAGAGSTNFATYSTSLTSYLSSGDAVKRVIRTADGTMYVMDNGLKRPIGAYSTYLSTFSSEGYSNISYSLANSIATGQLY